MKVIKNNYDKNITSIHRVICDYCESELEITNSDISFNKYGNPVITCPICGRETCVAYDTKEITVENIAYPDDFYSFENGLDISNEKIKEWIKDGYENMNKRNTDFYYVSSGNTFVFMHNTSGELYIMVTKNFKDISIDKE